MNHCFPDWNIEAELPVPNQKKPFGLDHELVELLWENGQVVLNSQTHRKSASSDPRQQVSNKHLDHQSSNTCANPTSLIQDNETLSWIHHCQVVDGDPFDKEFSSNFLAEIPLPNHKVLDDNDKFCKIDPSNFGPNPLLAAPRFQSNNNNIGCGGSKCPKHVVPSSPMKKQDLVIGGGEAREYSMRSSHCESNQVAVDAADYTSRASSCGIGNTNNSLSAAMTINDYGGNFGSQNERGERETHGLATTSSSGGSGGTCAGTDSLKRKCRDAEDSECQSDALARKKLASISGTVRKSRAAQVHNLSERRRRDRINEKMRTLQELLPHSNKSDKASMLDEAIEYMKSLQLQLQMMWMGSGMAPMMFPGVQHYMSRLGMRLGPPTLPLLPNPMHLSRLPMVDHTMNVAAPPPNQAPFCPTTVMNHPMNFPEQYASYMGMGLHPMQTSSQPMNIFGFGPNMGQQQNPAFPPPNSTNGSSAG